MINKTYKLVKSILLVSSASLVTNTKIVSAQTCSWQGQTFQRGESLGSRFETLCGSYEEFPCYCNPDFSPPVECPYCGFAQQGGDLLCAADNEIVTYIDLSGTEKTCGCSAPAGGTPTPNCNLPNQGGPSSGATCTIDLPDGTSRTFNDGDSLGDFLPNRCGSEFPCFCNPAVQGQIECPYCRFASLGGNLACARDGESASFQDMMGVAQTCSCQLPNNPNSEAIVNCIPSSPDSTTPPPVDAPTGAPVETPSLPNDSQTDVCTLELPSGQIVTFQNGESYGEYLPTRCGTTDDYPCFCNTALPNKVECPYCGFAVGSGSLLCAHDGETISFQDGSITRTCYCEIPDDPFQEPIRTCGVGLPPPANPPISDPTSPSNVCTVIDRISGNEFVVVDGGSFGSLINGQCGPAEEWPAFCSAQTDQIIASRQQGANGHDLIGSVVYPYCIFDDTANGAPICARNNEEVTYVNANGIEVTCGCVYLGPALGGAQASCRETDTSVTRTPAPVGDTGSSPTAAPNADPETSDESSATSMMLGGASVALTALSTVVWFL